MDTSENSEPQAISEVTIPNPFIRKSLEAALYFKATQEDNEQIRTITECVTVVSHMINRLYKILEAIVSFRAKYLYAVKVVTPASPDTHDQLDDEYERLTRSIQAGTIPNDVVGALTAFLVSGVKGLMVYPKDVKRYGVVKLTHFFVLCDKLQEDKPIKEPIWKWTQRYILDTIEAALFPGGLKKAKEDLESSVCDDKWEHADFSKYRLTKAIEVDFYNFCTHRSLFPGGESYKHPLFELPDIPASKTPKAPKISAKSSNPLAKK
jgi:hypothetical protein